MGSFIFDSDDDNDDDDSVTSVGYRLLADNQIFFEIEETAEGKFYVIRGDDGDVLLRTTEDRIREAALVMASFSVTAEQLANNLKAFFAEKNNSSESNERSIESKE